MLDDLYKRDGSQALVLQRRQMRKHVDQASVAPLVLGHLHGIGVDLDAVGRQSHGAEMRDQVAATATDIQNGQRGYLVALLSPGQLLE